ncbi:PilZ domain-containing protein [Pseudoxanthomonas taiwanensis]|uniref:Atypical PilZ domain-containing cyclic di-GMP receptor n=1 Tax=Pseudoxanthomonas taiwanensis J19 TaxID=935569 RepID=A0A562DJ82_9GAMM|nr:PilZ domain-containing protein [Pseudoxanthomonas taiwanensis]TWH09613.1 atypical PilZ domain-containing cyclic di-GMP receptor [Pseudoxanthomonas taiwanensis J19]
MNNPAWPATAQAAEHGLFGDVLTCDAVLPASYLADATARTAQAEALLQGLAQVEDLRGSEDSGEEKRGELPLLAQRLDAKLDLVLVLLGRLVRQANPPLPPTPLRWSVRGLRLQLAADAALPEPDSAAARGPQASWVWLRFPALPPGLEEAMGRHLFRMHRRQVADARRR